MYRYRLYDSEGKSLKMTFQRAPFKADGVHTARCTSTSIDVVATGDATPCLIHSSRVQDCDSDRRRRFVRLRQPQHLPFRDSATARQGSLRA